MTAQVNVNTKGALLVKVLRADGVFATASGLILLLFSGSVADLIDLNRPVALLVLGFILLAYGASLLFSADRQPENRQVASMAIVLNLLWVAGSYAGLLFDFFPVNTAGKWAVALVAEAVFLFAVAEYIALRRLRD